MNRALTLRVGLPVRQAVAMRLVTGSAGVLVAVLLATTGCQGQGPALTRTDLVSDLAGRIDHAAEANYVALYQVSGGLVISVANNPEVSQTTYWYGAHGLVIRGHDVFACTSPEKGCTKVKSTTPDSTAAEVTEVLKLGLIPPSTLDSLLTSAALDISTDYQQHEATISGQPATCVEVHNLDSPLTTDFEACVLSDGVIGSFKGDVSGTKIDFAMSSYSGYMQIDPSEEASRLRELLPSPSSASSVLP